MNNRTFPEEQGGGQVFVSGPYQRLLFPLGLMHNPSCNNVGAHLQSRTPLLLLSNLTEGDGTVGQWI